MRNQDNLFTYYKELGFCCIPIVPKTKRPAIPSWQKFQYAFPADEECEEWDKKLAMGLVGIALVCGENSGVIAIDLDSTDWFDLFPLGGCRKVGERGETRLYSYSGEKTSNIDPQDDRKGIEVRGNGNYIVIPPSIHPNGFPYQWIGGELSRDALSPLPEGLLDSIRIKFGRTIEEVVDTSAGLAICLTDAMAMLDAIDCAALEYKEWVEVGMGLHYEFGDEALPIFDSWSKKDAPRYNAGECKLKWESFSNSKKRSITMKTVISLATKAGFRMPSMVEEVTEDPKNPQFPIPPLPESLILRAPGILGRITRDVYRCSPMPNLSTAFAVALAGTAAFKSKRIKSDGGIRPVILVAVVAGSGTGKEYPMDWIKIVFNSIADPERKAKDGGTLTLRSWHAQNLASGQGLVSLIKDGRRLLLWDEIGQYLYQGVKSSNQSSQNILTRLTEISTKANSVYQSDAYANHDGDMPIEDIENPHISLYGATNHKDIFKAIEATDLGGGSWARLLFIFGPQYLEVIPNFKKTGIDQEIIKDIAEWINRNPSIGEPREIVLGDECDAFLRAKAQELIIRKRTCPPVQFEFLNRLLERTIQVALIAWDGGPDAQGKPGWDYSGSMPLEILEWAYDVVNWLITNFCENAIPYNFSRSTVERLRNAVLRILKNRETSHKDVMKALPEWDEKEIEKTLGRLERDGIIKVRTKNKIGTPGPNPVLYSLV